MRPFAGATAVHPCPTARVAGQTVFGVISDAQEQRYRRRRDEGDSSRGADIFTFYFGEQPTLEGPYNVGAHLVNPSLLHGVASRWVRYNAREHEVGLRLDKV